MSERQGCDNVVLTLSDVATKRQPKTNVVTASCASRVDMFPDIPSVPDRWILHGEWTWNTHTHTHTKVLSGIKHTLFHFKRTLYLWLTKLCTNHVKFIKINLFT